MGPGTTRTERSKVIQPSFWRSVVTVVLGAAATTLVGCGAEPHTAPAAPAFTGPYASDFTQAWDESDSDFVREVLRDERISDQEWAEVGTRITDCFSRNGVTFLGFEDDGSYSIDPGSVDASRANELLAECEGDSGEDWIGYLRNQSLRNPENLDLDQLTADCLVDRRAVAPDYTVEDYRRDVESQGFPYLDPVAGPEIFAGCNRDPLGLLDAG